MDIWARDWLRALAMSAKARMRRSFSSVTCSGRRKPSAWPARESADDAVVVATGEEALGEGAEGDAADAFVLQNFG